MRWSRFASVALLLCAGLILVGWGLTPGLAAPRAPVGYPAGTRITPLGAAQPDPVQERAAYAATIRQLKTLAPVDWTAVTVTAGSQIVPPGAALGLPAGSYAQQVVTAPLSVGQAYALQPRRIALFYPTLRDDLNQTVAWEAAHFDQLLRLYLEYADFAVLTETQITTATLAGYDLLILPAVRLGWESRIADTLGMDGLVALYDYVQAGGFVYAQSNGAWLLEEAGLLPAGTVDLTSPIVDSTDNRLDLTLDQSDHPLTFGWPGSTLYILSEPTLRDLDGSLTIVASFAEGTASGSPAIATAQSGAGEMVLINGHPTAHREDSPQALDALLWALSERGGLSGSLCQTYNNSLACDLIPAYEPNLTLAVTTTFRNVWDGALTGLRITETVQPGFTPVTATISPAPADILHDGALTRIVWAVDSVAPGTHDFTYQVTTGVSGTTGGLVSSAEATFTDPFRPAARTRTVTRHDLSIRAKMAARLQGDRDIELDVIYPFPAEGWYFDISLTLENKEETDAHTTRITDVVALVSPIVDVNDQHLIPHVIQDAWGPSNSDELSQTLWAINDIYFYDTPVPLYPMPTTMDGVTGTITAGTHYSIPAWLAGPRNVYTFTGPFTTTAGFTNSVTIPPELASVITLTAGGDLLLPAVEMTWDFGSLPAYDYLDPAVRYGLWSHETRGRTVYFISDPYTPSLIMEGFGGSVFTNLGIHPIPYEEYLSHGIIYIPTPHTLPRVSYTDIWGRPKVMELRTVFYDIVPFPPPEYHAVVNTTFEMKADLDGDGLREARVSEVPTRDGVDLTLNMKTFSNFDPTMPPLRKDETLIDQWMFRGLGFDLKPANGSWWNSWQPLDLQGVPNATELVTVTSTPAYEMLYFQQYLESQRREAWVLSATLSVPPTRHYEGSMKIDNGARFVYHQKAAGPSRYEVFDAHTLVAFGKSADATVSKEVAPTLIATYSDTLYHLIKVEDRWDPRDPGWGPFVRSYGFGDTAATTFVGGRHQAQLLFGRVRPGDVTQIRLDLRNNQNGITITNLVITPHPPAGITVTLRPTAETLAEAPLFFDFPTLHQTTIIDGWRSVWYYNVEISPNFTDTGKVIEIPFTASGNGLPTEFTIPPAQIAVENAGGHVTTVWGQAQDLQVTDDFAPGLAPQQAWFATVPQGDDLEAALALGNDYSATLALQSMIPAQIVTTPLASGTRVSFTLPTYAGRMPWLQNGLPTGAYFLVVRSTSEIAQSGTQPANLGARLTFRDDFGIQRTSVGNAQNVEVHGARLVVTYTVEEAGPPPSRSTGGFIPGRLNEALVRIDVENQGDYPALTPRITVTLDSNVTLTWSSVPTAAQGPGWVAYSFSDMGPGQLNTVKVALSTTPQAGATSPWRLIAYSNGRFINEFPTRTGLRQILITRQVADQLTVGAGRLNTRLYLPIVARNVRDWWPTVQK